MSDKKKRLPLIDMSAPVPAAIITATRMRDAAVRDAVFGAMHKAVFDEAIAEIHGHISIALTDIEECNFEGAEVRLTRLARKLGGWLEGKGGQNDQV